MDKRAMTSHRSSLVYLLALVSFAWAPLATADSPRYHGQIEAVGRADVYSHVEGIVEHVFVAQGDYVGAGDPLLRLRQDLEQLAVEAAKANLSKADASLLRVRRQVDRLTRLSSTGAASETAVQDAEVELLLAQAERDLAQNALAMAQLRLEDTIVRAPIAGFVEDPRVGVGSAVEFSSGDPPLFQIVSLDPVHVVFEVPYAHAPAQSRDNGRNSGDRLTSRLFSVLDSEGGILESHLSPSASAVWVDPQTGTIRTWAEVQNPNLRFLPGMQLTVVATGAIRSGLAQQSDPAEE